MPPCGYYEGGVDDIRAACFAAEDAGRACGSLIRERFYRDLVGTQ